jgi:transglutaminase-like putative cysteine protease
MIQFRSRFVVPKITQCLVPRGQPGTLVTARLMGRLIRDGAKDFYVRQKAIQIFRQRGVRPKDRFGEVCALFEWVHDNVRYTRDIFRVELLHSARRMLELRAGDCDDMTILLGAMLISTGHPVRLALAGFRRNRPHSYSHVYPEVHVSGRWIAIDASTDRPVGWAPPAVWKRVCDIEKDGIRCSPRTC